MGEFFFNIDHGYLEALVRGFKGGILTQADYANLVQCETLEDLKLHIQSTDYGNFLANEPGAITVGVIDERLKEKLVTEFTHIRNNALEPLATFLDYITYSYMIDNIILLITGTLHQRPISELISKCHPLGSFEQMEAIHKLGYGLNEAVAELSSRAQGTIQNVQDNFTSNKTGVPDMLNTVSDKFGNWPVTAFLVVCVTGLILIIVGLIFLCSKGVAYYTETRYKKAILSHPSDIENL